MKADRGWRETNGLGESFTRSRSHVKHSAHLLLLHLPFIHLVLANFVIVYTYV